MKEITAHKANGLNEAIKILALDAPGAGGAHHVYELSGAGATVRLEFQNGPVKEAGFNGISIEALLAVAAHRLECFQAGPFACKDNEDALAMVKGGLTCLLKRTKKRVEQGVEGKNEQHAEAPPKVDTAAAPAAVPFGDEHFTAVRVNGVELKVAIGAADTVAAVKRRAGFLANYEEGVVTNWLLTNEAGKRLDDQDLASVGAGPLYLNPNAGVGG